MGVSQALPECKRKLEVRSEAQAHMSLYAANMSSLAKIADPEMFEMVLNATAQSTSQKGFSVCW